jgi:hypothetical protein
MGWQDELASRLYGYRPNRDLLEPPSALDEDATRPRMWQNAGTKVEKRAFAPGPFFGPKIGVIS